MGKMCCLVHDEKVLIHDIGHIKCMLHTVNYSCEILRNFAIYKTNHLDSNAVWVM